MSHTRLSPRHRRAHPLLMFVPCYLNVPRRCKRLRPMCTNVLRLLSSVSFVELSWMDHRTASFPLRVVLSTVQSRVLVVHSCCDSHGFSQCDLPVFFRRPPIEISPRSCRYLLCFGEVWIHTCIAQRFVRRQADRAATRSDMAQVETKVRT